MSQPNPLVKVHDMVAGIDVVVETRKKSTKSFDYLPTMSNAKLSLMVDAPKKRPVEVDDIIFLGNKHRFYKARVLTSPQGEEVLVKLLKWYTR